jgi:hypothetical protein
MSQRRPLGQSCAREAYLCASCRDGIPIARLGVTRATDLEVTLSYVKRLVAALLGLFVILVVVGLLSKVGLGFLSLAAAILAMALAWLAQYRRRPVPAWRLIPAACLGVALAVYWALGAFGTLGEGLITALIAGAVGGTFLSSGILLVIAAALGSRARKLGLDTGSFGQD